jgi:hypothetical protein
MFSVTWAVIWPGKIGADAGDERGRDDGAGLKDVRRRRSNDAIGRDGAPIGRRVEEGVLAILRRGSGRRRREAEARQIRRMGGSAPAIPAAAGAPRLSIRKKTAGPRGLDLLKAALLFRLMPGIGRGDSGRRHGLAAILGAEDRSPEVTGKWRTELRHATVISRQAGQAVSGRAVLGRIEFVVRPTAVAGLKRVDQRTAEPDAGDKTEAGENLPR